MSERERLADEIYAAAWLPSLWPEALKGLARLSGSFGAALVSRKNSTRWIGTPSVEPVIKAYMDGGWWTCDTRAARAAALLYPGFVADNELYSPEELEHDTFYVDFLRKFGLGWSLVSAIPSRDQGAMILSVERLLEAGPVDPSLVRVLDPYRFHFAQAVQISERLGTEQAQTASRILKVLGLPAAVIGDDGRVMAVNSLFEDLRGRLVARAFGRVGVSYRPAAKLLDQEVSRLVSTAVAVPVAIPVPVSEEGPALVLRLVPVRREAGDIFARAVAILVVTPLECGAPPPAPILQGLFDLSPMEAKVAGGIASGGTIETIARTHGKSRETIRSQLRSIFSKTGTTRQAELVGLLARAQINLTV
ncbi:LuxR family transcriptional regulator [Oleomonas cavernae]|uniref:LuxR family transcriptional regulator n=1 Tax=Oleomonas cavernae TaxID=2320859 RepID=A0A418W8Z1_9PROT|nr:PAS domain-containing protein [Oleomonas cavernae]RJF86472.1 LuxR family transcriptional regulator [Oleomonas cavernae]